MAQLSGNERQRLYKQAAKLRKSAQNGRRGGSADTGRSRSALLEEDAPGFEKLARGPSASLDDWVLRLLKEEELEVTEPAPVEGMALREGLVVAVGAGRCTVLAEGETLDCLLRPELTVAQQSAIAVGDEVRFSRTDDGETMVEEVLPRRATLSRPDPFYRHIERVVAANIDAVVIVVSVKTPPLHPKLIDRYLIAVQRGGAEPLLCVNKIDLLATEAERAVELSKLQPYRELGLRTHLCSF